MLRILASAIVLIILQGCAASTALRPNIAKRSWTELRSKHFDVTTDLPSKKAAALVLEMETLWKSIADNYGLILPDKPLPTGRFRMVHLASCDDFEAIIWRPGIGGYVSNARDFSGDRVLVACEQRFVRTEILVHELVHRFNGHFFWMLPPWLNEGLATYFQTIKVGGGRVVLGNPSTLDAGKWKRGHRLPKLRQLLDYSYEEFYKGGDRRNYFAGWILVHLLTNSSEGYRRRFQRYLRALSEVGDRDSAWNDAFGAMAFEKIEDEYRTYHSNRELVLLGAAYEPKEVVSDFESRTLRQGEAHAVWIQLMITKASATESAADREAVSKQLQLAASSDEGWSGLLFWRAIHAASIERSEEKSLLLLREYLKEEPSDGRAHLGIVHIMKHTAIPKDYYGFGPVPKSVATLEADVMALVGVASTPNELNAVASYFALQQNPKTGLGFARRALAKEPSCIRCLDSLALLLFQLDRVDEALATQKRAINMLAENEPPPSMLARLRHYEEVAKTKRTSPDESTPAKL